MPVSLLRLAFIGLGIALTSPVFAAEDAESIARSFSDAVSASGRATVTYDQASSEASTVTLSNVVIAAGDGSSVTIPSLVFSGVEPRQAGGFIADEVLANNGNIAGENRTVAWETATFGQVTIPSHDEIAAAASITPFLEVSLGALTLTDKRLAAPLTLASVSTTVTSAPDGSPAGLAVDADGLTIPVSLFAGSVPGMLLQMMQYQELVADIDLEGTYDAATDIGVLQTLTLDSRDAGKITVRGAFSGLALAEAASPDAEISKDARADARLDRLSVRIDNYGFVERMLDAQASMLGGSRDDIRNQLISGALPLALSFVKNEPFRAEFLAAATAFLQNPQSLTIAFQPAEPVPLGQFVRTLTRSPTALPDLLSPAVEANIAEQQ